jgi:hypothetical protein
MMTQQQDIQLIKIDRLLFDWENPRLPQDDEDLDLDSQESIFRYVEDSYSLRELGQSFADNGYFREEPLHVVPHDGKFRVVEGNRRLAALKLISDPDARRHLTKQRREFWDAIAETRHLDQLRMPLVTIHEDRDKLLSFLGFRHISGVKRWRPEAKARYLTQLMRRERLNFRETARRIGSQAPAVRRQAEAYTVLQQASQQDLPVESAMRYFGLFYNALQDPGIRNYTGLPEPGDVTSITDEPIPPDRLSNVHRILRWLFGEEGRRRIISESRDISKLGRVLSNERAARSLEKRPGTWK